MQGTSRSISIRTFTTLLALVLAVLTPLSVWADNCCVDRDVPSNEPVKQTCCQRHGDDANTEKEAPDSRHDCGAGCLSICCRAMVVVVASPDPVLNYELPAVAPTLQPEAVPHTPETAAGIFHPPRA